MKKGMLLLVIALASANVYAGWGSSLKRKAAQAAGYATLVPGGAALGALEGAAQNVTKPWNLPSGVLKGAYKGGKGGAKIVNTLSGLTDGSITPQMLLKKNR